MPKIVVLVSGSGTNLQAIIDAIKTGVLNCKISTVIADRDCYAIERAKAANIPAYIVERKLERANLSQTISKYIDKDCDLIILAGFLSILDGNFTKSWENKIINIHPSLLPKYGGAGMWGLKVHQAVLANKDTESGCTVHFVNDEIDGGKIIHQERIPVYPADDAQTLQKRLIQVEHQALVLAIKKLLSESKNIC